MTTGKRISEIQKTEAKQLTLGKAPNFAEYLGAKKHADLYFDFVNQCAMVDAGLAYFLLAPPNGAKSTLIKALLQWYEGTRFTFKLQRISPMRFLRLQERINNADNLFVSEDFSSLADSEDSVFKMATIIAMLSYDGNYCDPFFATKEFPQGLNIEVKSLAFVCGMQPQWLQVYGNREVFETLIMEKILRYYRLPITTIPNIEPQATMVKSILEQLKTTQMHTYEVKEEWIKYLAKHLKAQCGARGIEYARKLMPELCKYVPENIIVEWLEQFAFRFKFEEKFLLRKIEPLRVGIQSQALFHEYAVLFFAMQFNPLTYGTLKDLCKIRGKTESATKRYMRLLTRYALDAGYINVMIKDRTMHIVPSDDYKRYSIHKFPKSFLSEKQQQEA